MKSCIAVAAFALACSVSAQAALIEFRDRAEFESQGTIAFYNDFESYNTSSGFFYPGNPWTAEGVTYTSTDNLIVGVNSQYTNQSNHIANNYWTPITGTLDGAGQFNMFAFDVAVYGNSNLSLSLTTNLFTYTTSFAAPDANVQSLDFWGFTLTEGEYFTGFRLVSAGSNNLGMMDNVTLGSTLETSAVPEPTTLALFGIGLVGLGLRKLSKR